MPVQLHSDKDGEDGKVKYVLTGEGAGTIFVINENSGDLHATRRLDREEKASYTLSAKAVDKVTGQDLEGPSTFIIKIHDINDNEPKFTQDPYVASVQEMADVGKALASHIKECHIVVDIYIYTAPDICLAFSLSVCCFSICLYFCLYGYLSIFQCVCIYISDPISVCLFLSLSLIFLLFVSISTRLSIQIH